MVAPPTGMGLLADSRRMGVAGTRVAPSEEPVTLGPAMLEPTALEPAVP